jgi:hypothetical protein
MLLKGRKQNIPGILKTIAIIITLMPMIGFSQSDVLILQKDGRNIKTYAPGQPIIFQTVYDQWFDGTLTALRNDSVFINGIPFHYNEIRTMRVERTKLNYFQDGTLLMVAGVGVLALNTINGLYRKDKARNWFSTSGWITAGALILGGILLKKTRIKTYPLGKKYGLHYLDLHSDNPKPVVHPPGNSP